MESRSCPRNHTRTVRAATGSVLCGRCMEQLERNLRMLPVLHEELLHDMSSTPKRINPTKVSVGHWRDHLNMFTFDTRHDILTILGSWSGSVVENFGTAAPERSVPHLAHFLLCNLRWLTAQPSAADFADEIETLYIESIRATNAETGDHDAVTVTCAMDNCLGTIDTTPRIIAGAGMATISCSLGHSWEVREWLLLAQLGRDDERAPRDQAATP
jgi:hypothetical protein